MSGAQSRRAGEDFQEHRLAGADGVTLYVRDYKPVEPVTGWPVFCLPGLTRNSRDFEVPAPRIAALGRRVLAWDTRGRGKSDRDPDASRYNAMVYAQDAIRTLDHFGIDKAVFLGTSMGGIISMIVSTIAPQRIAATILNDIGPVLDPAGFKRIAGYVGKTGAVTSWEQAAAACKAINGAAFPDADDVFWMRFARNTFRQNSQGGFEPDYDPAIAQAMSDAPQAEPPDMTALFQALAPTGPVLVVRGGLSDLLSADGVEKMRAIKPDLDVVVAPRAGHAPMLEEPEAWEAMIDFLAKVP